MSTDEISAIHLRLDKQDKVLSSIHTALVGDPAMGTDGLVPRVKVMEAKVAGHERTMLKWAGIATGASLVVTALKDRLFG